MEIENVLQRLDRQIKGERDTINTILNLRGAVGSAARQTTEDGMAKSIENAVMCVMLCLCYTSFPSFPRALSPSPCSETRAL